MSRKVMWYYECNCTGSYDRCPKHGVPRVTTVKEVKAWKREQRGAPPDTAIAALRDDNWFASQALDVIRHARINEPHDEWLDWQSAIVNGLLRAFNRGRAAGKQEVSE